MTCFEYQWYTWGWHYSKIFETYEYAPDHIHGYYQHTLCLGPLQMRWKS